MNQPTQILATTFASGVSSRNYQLPYTYCIHFPDYVGDQPGAGKQLGYGSLRVMTKYVFRNKVA